MSRPVLLVAGGSRGIGAAVARLAGKSGYDVAVNYNSNASAAASVVKDIEAFGGRAIALRGDMGREADIERVFTETDKFGRLTHFVHSSGIIGPMSRLDEASTETIRRRARCRYLRRALVPARLDPPPVHQARRSRRLDRHDLVDGGRDGGATECIWYAAAKGAVDSMVIGAGRELAREGIRVNGVSPGMIDTDIQPPGRIEKHMGGVPIGRAGSPDEVADGVLYLLSDKASYVTGSNLRISGGR